jgi:hypothetical protein
MGAQSTTIRCAEHSAASNGGDRSAHGSIFDNGAWNGDSGLDQLSVVALFSAPVVVAARHAVNCALSTTEHANAMS